MFFLLQGGRLRTGVSPDSVRIYQTTRLHFPTDFTIQEQKESAFSFLLKGGRLRPGVSPDSVRIYQTTRLHFPTDFTIQEQKIYGLRLLVEK